MKPRDLENVNTTIKYPLSLSQNPPGVSEAPFHTSTASFIEIFAAKMKGDARNSLKDIDEIVALCRELLTSDTPRSHLTSVFESLTRAMLDDFTREKRSQCLDQAIECFRDAMKACPSGFHHISLNLANLLVARFLTFEMDDDYREAETVLYNITHPSGPSSPQSPPDPYQVQASALNAALGMAGSIVYSNFKDWEGGSRCRAFLEHCSLFGNPLHPAIVKLLAIHAERVSEHLDPAQGVKAAHLEVHRLPFLTQLEAFGDAVDESDIVAPVPSLIALEDQIVVLRGFYSTARPGTEYQRKCLKDLVHCYNTKISLTNDSTFIEEAINYNRVLIKTTHPTDQSKFLHLSTFGDFLYAAFDRSKSVKYLDESVIIHREVLELKNARLAHFSIIRRLIWSLSTRWRLFRCKSDLEEIMDLFSTGVTGAIATDLSRFELACCWAHAARMHKHHSLPSAYRNALSSMQSSLVFGPRLPIQHNVESSDLYRTPLNFASYQARVCQLEGAIETLEQGRVLLWSEMCGLRNSTDQLCAANPALAERFQAINRELEILNTFALSNGGVGMDGGDSECDEWIGQLSGIAERQHKLLTARDALISQIRDLPDLKNFLVSLPFDTLRSAASRGPVIVINHCKWRSDIFIVLHDYPLSHIPTPYDFFDRAICLKDELLTAREKYGLDSEQYENALSFVLMGLYELIGRPVIERLNKLRIAEQSRVWWCSTSVFGSLPLHAMGPIPSDGGDLRYFSDVYIPSYTPTLSALIASREPDTRAPALLTLLVSQPVPSMPGAWPDVEAIYESYGLDFRAAGFTPGNTISPTVRYLSSAYVSSHALTLSGLILSQELGTQSSAPPTQLIVQPGPSTPVAPGAWPKLLDAQVLHDFDLQPENISSSTVLDRLQCHQFVCVTQSGKTKTSKPFEASMWFPDGECLTLLDIVRSRQPAGESALLLGPHTAEPTGFSDEELPLPGAMQFSGFRSVIGTMWGMGDEDGQDIAEAVYQSVFSGKGGETYYERSARALQHVLQQKRRGLPLARWVNYVHYGA